MYDHWSCIISLNPVVLKKQEESAGDWFSGEELVACEQVLQWLRKAKSNQMLEVSDMAAPRLGSYVRGRLGRYK